MLDVSLSTRRAPLCNGIARRDFLRVGALGPLGLSLGGWLGARSAAADEARKARAKSVVLVFLGGGLSHHDTFDLKPEAPPEIRGKYSSIPTSVPGIRIGELLPMMARAMDKVALVRSGAHTNDHHETASNWVLSGRFGSAFGDHPSIGSVVAHESGFTANLPPYISVPRNPSFTWELGRSVWLGGRYESFRAGDPNVQGYKVRDLGAAENLTDARADRRRNLLEAVDSLASKVKGDDQLGTYDEFHRRAAEMILSPEAQAAFDVEAERPELRERYGRNTFGQGCLLARRLVERGVRFVTINYGGWDHHEKIWNGLEKKVPEFDRGFSALVEDLHRTGLISETLVVCMGEFGRTPKINDKGGRDHWGPAASLLFAGAGVRGGQVIGATDRTGSEVVDRPVRPGDVAATIYRALGIDPRRQIVAPDGRPHEILPEGEAVRELYA